ncbi:hypothetical protein [Subtercola frigoramans]|uniref:Uncharacterized protein n=1 Tax=Subtercola frigoramans TaxID=120298 RepID=A0ABS2L358_9MICO|nr:hypothetical protein [Subtercola frigoramans]MBM7471170.1 hypothetical protein [Subtercola frigoramans]
MRKQVQFVVTDLDDSHGCDLDRETILIIGIGARNNGAVRAGELRIASADGQ